MPVVPIRPRPADRRAAARRTNWSTLRSLSAAGGPIQFHRDRTFAASPCLQSPEPRSPCPCQISASTPSFKNWFAAGVDVDLVQWLLELAAERYPSARPPGLPAGARSAGGGVCRTAGLSRSDEQRGATSCGDQLCPVRSRRISRQPRRLLRPAQQLSERSAGPPHRHADFAVHRLHGGGGPGGAAAVRRQYAGPFCRRLSDRSPADLCRCVFRRRPAHAGGLPAADRACRWASRASVCENIFVRPPPRDIAVRVLRNLKSALAMERRLAGGAAVQLRLASLEPHSADERRDLGLLLLRNGQPHQALPLLEQSLAGRVRPAGRGHSRPRSAPPASWRPK